MGWGKWAGALALGVSMLFVGSACDAQVRAIPDGEKLIINQYVASDSGLFSVIANRGQSKAAKVGGWTRGNVFVECEWADSTAADSALFEVFVYTSPDTTYPRFLHDADDSDTVPTGWLCWAGDSTFSIAAGGGNILPLNDGVAEYPTRVSSRKVASDFNSTIPGFALLRNVAGTAATKRTWSFPLTDAFGGDVGASQIAFRVLNRHPRHHIYRVSLWFRPLPN